MPDEIATQDGGPAGPPQAPAAGAQHAAPARSPTPPPRPPARPPIKLPSPLGVITVALGIFLIALTLMAIQVRNGRDPALGPGPVPATSGQPVTGAGKTSQTQAAQVVTKASPVPP